VKPLSSDDYRVNSFVTHKNWSVEHEFLGPSNNPDVRILIADQPPEIPWVSFSENISNVNVDGTFTEPLYVSVNHVFYTGSFPIEGTRYINIDPSTERHYPSGSRFFVVNVSQQSYGEGILPGTFKISSLTSTSSIVDSGNGVLISSSSISSEIVGNIFYNSGVAIITSDDIIPPAGGPITNNGLQLDTGSMVTVDYRGTHTIYEHRVVCTMEPEEFNFSTNPTMINFVMSGSISASQFVPEVGPRAGDLVLSGSLSPYMTTIGLFTDLGELVAVAKVSNPLKRVSKSQQTIIVKFDS